MDLQRQKQTVKTLICFLTIFLIHSFVLADICNPNPSDNSQPPHSIKDLLKSAAILRNLNYQKSTHSELINDLTKLRNKMEAYTLAFLNEDKKKNLPISFTQKRIESDFKNAKLDDGGLTEVKIKNTGDDTACVFADYCKIELGSLDSETGYLAFKTYINIYCGNEIGFTLLQQSENIWKPILCDTVSNENKPLNLLKYSIFHRKDEAANYVVVARLSTWCQSVWQNTHVTVFRIDNEFTNAIFNYEISTVTDSENPNDDMLLNRLPNGFSIKVSNGDGTEPGFRFKHTYQFTIKNGMVSNIAIQGLKPKNS
jgi:hypothetical protein